MTNNLVPKPIYKVVAPVGSGHKADYLTDGSNDEVQIQAAINEVTVLGGTVLLKSGTYYIQNSIIIKDNVWLKGEGWGSVLEGHGTTNFAIIKRIETPTVPSRNWHISDLKIDGSNVVQAVYTTSAKGIFCGYMTNCKVTNVYVYSTSATGIALDWPQRCVIDGCVVEGAGRDFGAGGGPTVGGNGIGLATGGFPAEGLGPIQENNCVITNCHAVNCGNNGIMYEQQDSNDSKYVSIVNCTAQGCHDGFRLSGVKNGSISGCFAMENDNYGMVMDIGPIGGSPNVDSLLVTGNSFSQNTKAGIVITSTTNNRRVVIANNIVDFNTEVGVYIIGGSRILVQNNIIHDNALSGIRVVSTSSALSNFQIQDNSIHNNGTAATSGNRDGILLDISGAGTISDTIISGNRIFDNQGTQTQEYGIRITNATTRLEIVGNNLNGNKLGGLLTDTAGIGNLIQNNIGITPDQEAKSIYAKNTSGGSLAIGDVVTLKAVAAGNEVTTTTTQGDDLVYGMATATIANDAFGYVQVLGKTTSLKVDGTTDIAIGDFLGTFTTAKIAAKAGAGDMAFAIALEAYTTNDSAGVIDALLITPRKI